MVFNISLLLQSGRCVCLSLTCVGTKKESTMDSRKKFIFRLFYVLPCSWSDPFLSCCSTYEYHGVCRPVLTKASVTVPLTTPKITTAALPVTTANTTTTAQISTQTNKLPKDEPIIQVQRKMVMIFITYWIYWRKSLARSQIISW